MLISNLSVTAKGASIVEDGNFESLWSFLLNKHFVGTVLPLKS